MVKFRSIKQIEHAYNFKNAVVEADVLNGDFGVVEDGVFAVGANAAEAIMQVENGDDEGIPEYKIVKGSHVRVVDFAKMNGEEIEIYDNPLPVDVKVGDKLASDENGKLVAGASAAPYFEVTAFIGNKLGVVATIVAE